MRMNISPCAVIPVAPRMGRVSRNDVVCHGVLLFFVAPRMGRVSRNDGLVLLGDVLCVAPRMGRVSRNLSRFPNPVRILGRAPHGACE